MSWFMTWFPSSRTWACLCGVALGTEMDSTRRRSALSGLGFRLASNVEELSLVSYASLDYDSRELRDPVIRCNLI